MSGMNNKHILRRKRAIEQYPEREFIAGHSLTTVENVICRSFGAY